MIRAKFRCQTVLLGEHGEQVKLGAVSSSDENDPNKSWSQYTPSGSIEMMITNPAAEGQFRPGREYFIDFTPAE